MSAPADTSAEAVERLAAECDAQAAMLVRAAAALAGDARGVAVATAARQTAEDTAATLRALLARAERAEAARTEAIREMADMARQAGSWRGIAEGKDAILRDLERERDRLRRAWLATIQTENSCPASGQPCGARLCGCVAEMEMLMREDDQRTAQEPNHE